MTTAAPAPSIMRINVVSTGVPVIVVVVVMLSVAVVVVVTIPSLKIGVVIASNRFIGIDNMYPIANSVIEHLIPAVSDV